MKPVLVLACLAAAALCSAAHAVDVYKWTDAKGVVHYGDRPASGAAAATVSVPGGGNSPEELEAAQASLRASRDKLDEPAYPGARSYRYRSRSQPSQKPAETGCEASWRQYEAAQACFDAHRAAGGKGVTGYGAAVCKELPQPSCQR